MEFELGLCPTTFPDNSIEVETIRYSNKLISNDTSEYEIQLCPDGQNCSEGNIYTIKLCPEGENCACVFNVSDFIWRDNGNCEIEISWTNPESNCALIKVELWKKSWVSDNPIVIYTDLRDETSSRAIYPLGDHRNDEYCRGCGISGKNYTVTDNEQFLPGMYYQVMGYFNFEDCGGIDNPINMGTLLYNTTSFTSGKVINKTSNNPNYYNVVYYNSHNLDLKVNNLRSADLYPYSSGEVVVLANLDQSYNNEPLYEDSTINSNSIDFNFENAIIVPFNPLFTVYPWE